MDACKSAIFAFQFVKPRILESLVSLVKPILQTITHLIQYTVLEIRFWSVKCTTITIRYAKTFSIFIHTFPFLSIKRCKRLQLLTGRIYMKTNHFKMLLNVFSTTDTKFRLYCISIILLLKNNLSNVCCEISKIGMNL